MKLDSKYFDSIRISKPQRQVVKAQQGCDWPDCSEAGSYPAPIGPDSDEKRHFCLEHVRIYNKSYNFFEGMNQKDIAAYQRSAHTGHRPTWNMGTQRNQPGARPDWQFQDPHELMNKSGLKPSDGHPSGRRVTSGQKRALDVLELDETTPPEDVKQRYKSLIKRYHPDANGGDRSLEEQLNKVIQAYNFLTASGFC